LLAHSPQTSTSLCTSTAPLHALPRERRCQTFDEVGLSHCVSDRRNLTASQTKVQPYRIQLQVL
jgi:hypothetical protein